LPIGQPRRIFRSGFTSFRPSFRPGPLIIGLLAATAGVGLWAVLSLPRAPAPASRTAGTQQDVVAQPAQVAVVDGGTLRLRDRVIRLSGVHPPSHGMVCEAGGQATIDCGAAAANALAALVRETAVACRVTEQDDSGNAYGVCHASGTELNRAVIAAGWARMDRDSATLQDAEVTARAQHRGVWASEPDARW
jgi:endonuclease YncB( thermonuclease family)